MLHSPCVTHKYFTELFCLSVIVLGNMAHETSASWNHTLLGNTPKMFGELMLVRFTRKKAENCTNIWVGISNHLLQKVYHALQNGYRLT